MDDRYNQWLGSKTTEVGMKLQRDLAGAYSGKPLFRGLYSNLSVNQFPAARQPKHEPR